MAAIVIYDYTQVKAACTGPRTDGKTPSVQHAKEMMELAFSRLGGLIRDTGVFYFTEVDG